MRDLKAYWNQNRKTVVMVCLLIVLLSLISRIHYVFFHSVAETLFIVTAALVYLLGVKTYKYSSDNYLLFIGVAYLFIAIIHMVHFLTYKGMGIFPELTENVPTQLWVFTRMVEAVTFALAPLSVRHKPSLPILYAGYALVTAAGFTAILTQVFPDCYIPGVGLTPFKIGMEYAAMGLMIAALFHLYIRRDDINPYVRRIMTIAIAAMILESMCFTLYTDVYGIMNFIGHILSIISTAVIYRGIVGRGFDLPYEMIFNQLVRRNEELKKLSQYKSEFLANMSHEMRTPLTSVIALTDELLREHQGPLTEEQQESLIEIRESSLELSKLINDLLDMAKIESDRMFLVLTEVDVGSVVCDVERQLRALALHHHIGITVVINNQGKVIADREKVRRVVQNLMFNAIKFTPEGGTIEVQVIDAPEDNPGTFMRVKDSGVGIPAKDRELIFESYFQADLGVPPKFSGTGLGLALVKKIMELHKGWVRVESAEGEGSVFETFWPRYPQIDDDLE